MIIPLDIHICELATSPKRELGEHIVWLQKEEDGEETEGVE